MVLDDGAGFSERFAREVVCCNNAIVRIFTQQKVPSYSVGLRPEDWEYNGTYV